MTIPGYDDWRPGIPDDVLDEVEMARTICFAWGHCAGGCQFKGARCLGDADSLLHGWQGRCANAALARLREARGKCRENGRSVTKEDE